VEGVAVSLLVRVIDVNCSVPQCGALLLEVLVDFIAEQRVVQE
jgi:hypothetical protein